LPNVEFLAVTGKDAGDFLQRQTTQDVAALPPGGAALAGWLDARGRVRGVFRVLRTHDRWLLAMTDQSAAALATDIGVYVLRNEVKLTIEHDWVAASRIGSARDWLSARAQDGAGRPAYFEQHAETFLVEIAPELFHLYGPSRVVEAIAGPIDGDAQPAISAEIEAGIPSIAPAVSQLFTAHMLNLDRLGAVAFTKGCYPGQEVTARTQNLGTVKRRALPFRCRSGAVPIPGADIIDAAGAAVGRVVRAAGDAQRTSVLAVVELERRATPLYLSVEGRPRLEPLSASE
jgi:folate-binding protein YgfZ